MSIRSDALCVCIENFSALRYIHCDTFTFRFFLILRTQNYFHYSKVATTINEPTILNECELCEELMVMYVDQCITFGSSKVNYFNRNRTGDGITCCKTFI